MDEADDVGEGGVVAEFELVVAFDAVVLADGGEHFGLFDGVDAEVGFEVEVEGEHVGRVAGLVGDQGEDVGFDVSVGRRPGAGSTVAVSGGGAACRRGRRRGGRGGGGAVADEADDVGEGGVVAEFELVVAFDAVVLADGGEHFGLFDGVDAEVGFEVEVEGEHVGRVAGLVGDQGEDVGFDVSVGRRPGLRRARRLPAPGRGALSSWARCVVVVGVRSRTKPMTWARVG